MATRNEFYKEIAHAIEHPWLCKFAVGWLLQGANDTEVEELAFALRGVKRDMANQHAELLLERFGQPTRLG